MFAKPNLLVSRLKIVLAVALLIAFFGAALLFADTLEHWSAGRSTKEFKFKAPENAQLVVSDIRVKGFSLSWPELSGEVEYAIAASSRGALGDYESAKENGYILLDFALGESLGGFYRATKMIAGKEYEIKLYARTKNTLPAEYLLGTATLPYLDDAELVEVYIDGEPAFYDKYEDSFSKIYLPGQEAGEYTVTYKTARQSELYEAGGEVKIEEGEFVIKDGEEILVTAKNEKLGAMRDYVISVRPLDNGIPLIAINVENSRPINSKTTYLKAELIIYDSATNPTKDYAASLFSGAIEIKGRGNSSFGNAKRGYNIELADKTAILNMAASRDWMLIGNYSDKTFMRNFIAYELYRDMGARFSPKLRFVDLALNGEYMGTYCFGERIKIDPGRLNLPKIKAEEQVKDKKTGTLIIPPTSGEDLSGSYVIEVNSTDKYSKDEIIFETKKVKWSEGHFFSIKQPGEKNLSPEAYEYISNYVNEAENALFADNFKDPDEGYRKYMDTASFVDWYIVNELFKNVDAGFHTSVYFYKPRDQKLFMGPVWDFDIAAGNIDYGGCDDPKGWHVRYSAWFSRLFEDEEFEEEFVLRWNYVKEKYLPQMFLKIDETASLLAQAQAQNFDKWPILGKYVWPNARGFERRDTYESEVEYLKQWLSDRIEWMDGEING